MPSSETTVTLLESSATPNSSPKASNANANAQGGGAGGSGLDKGEAESSDDTSPFPSSHLTPTTCRRKNLFSYRQLSAWKWVRHRRNEFSLKSCGLTIKQTKNMAVKIIAFITIVRNDDIQYNIIVEVEQLAT